MPLLFIVATIGVFLVSYGFVRLSAHYAHAGSVYAFSGATLGPQAGFFAGWALLGTYLAFTVGVGGGDRPLLRRVPERHRASGPAPEWVVIALGAAVLIGLLAYGDIKVTTRALLSMEAISVTLIIMLMVVIFAKLIGGTAPGHGDISRDVFSLPEGVGRGAFGLGAVLAFLSFAGFEGAAALGEETSNPKREIPRAIRNAVLAAGIFYIVCMLAQTLGVRHRRRGRGGLRRVGLAAR